MPLLPLTPAGEELHRFWGQQTQYDGVPYVGKMRDFLDDGKALSVVTEGKSSDYLVLDGRRLLQLAGRPVPAASRQLPSIDVAPATPRADAAAATDAAAAATPQQLAAAVARVYPPERSKDDFVKHHLAQWMLSYLTPDDCLCVTEHMPRMGALLPCAGGAKVSLPWLFYLLLAILPIISLHVIASVRCR